jgi:hypothetical protein
MTRPFPDAIWTPDEFHQQLCAALDESFRRFAERPEFEKKWRDGSCEPGTKTTWRHAPLLGFAADTRKNSGLLRFAETYFDEEQRRGIVIAQRRTERCDFDGFGNFSLSDGGSWRGGQNHTVMMAKVESKGSDLFGQISGLLSGRCPYKYLFIAPVPSMVDELNEFCESNSSCAVDWGGITYFVIEIPDTPSLPSTWKSYRADVQRDGDVLRFRTLS